MQLGDRYLKIRKEQLQRYPELLRFETFDQRYIALQEAGRRSMDPMDQAIAAAMMLALPCSGCLFMRHVPPQSIPYVIFGGFLLLAPGAFWFNARQRARVRRRLRELLNERGIKTCVPCGYDMKGLETVTCPECGGLGKKGLKHKDSPERRA